MSTDSDWFHAINNEGVLQPYNAGDFSLGTLIVCDGVEYFYSAQPVGQELFEPGHEPMYLSAYGEAFSVKDFAQLMRTSNKYPRIKYDSYCVKGLPE